MKDETISVGTIIWHLMTKSNEEWKATRIDDENVLVVMKIKRPVEQ